MSRIMPTAQYIRLQSNAEYIQEVLTISASPLAREQIVAGNWGAIIAPKTLTVYKFSENAMTLT
jgi:hypothetical protein